MHTAALIGILLVVAVSLLFGCSDDDSDSSQTTQTTTPSTVVSDNGFPDTLPEDSNVGEALNGNEQIIVIDDSEEEIPPPPIAKEPVVEEDIIDANGVYISEQGPVALVDVDTLGVVSILDLRTTNYIVGLDSFVYSDSIDIQRYVQIGSLDSNPGLDIEVRNTEQVFDTRNDELKFSGLTLKRTSTSYLIDDYQVFFDTAAVREHQRSIYDEDGNVQLTITTYSEWEFNSVFLDLAYREFYVIDDDEQTYCEISGTFAEYTYYLGSDDFTMTGCGLAEPKTNIRAEVFLYQDQDNNYITVGVANFFRDFGSYVIMTPRYTVANIGK